MSCFLPSPSDPSCPCGGGSAMPPCTEWPERLTPPMDCMIRAWSSILDAKESVHWATQIEKLIYEIGYSKCCRQEGVARLCFFSEKERTRCCFKNNNLSEIFLRESYVQVFAVLSLFYARSKVPKRVTMFVEKCINCFFFLTLLCQNWRSIVSRTNPHANLSFLWDLTGGMDRNAPWWSLIY